MTTNSLPLVPLVAADLAPLLIRVLRQEGVPTVDRREEPAAGRIVLFDSRRTACPPLVDGQTPVDVDAIRRELGFDPWCMADAGRTCRTFWQVGGYEASEETGVVDFGARRRGAMPLVRRLVEQAGGLWVRIAPFPWGYRSAFCFRFDHDEYVAEDFDAVLSAIAGHEQATTHFVCGATHGGKRDALARLRGLDVGSHGFYHHTYHDAAENRRNIARGIACLRDAGLEPSGFAAPHGRNPPGLNRVLFELGVTHTSQFGAVFDDLPFRCETGPWQMPIHPVCLGIVLESIGPSRAAEPHQRHAAAAAVAEHFVRVADAKLAAEEAIFLYGHPDGRLGRHPEILRTLLRHVDGLSGVWQTNFTALARWCEMRDRQRIAVRQSGDGWIVEAAPCAGSALPGPRLTVELSEGGRSIAVPLDERPLAVDRGRLRPAVRPIFANLPAPSRREPIRGIKNRLRRWLDWERTTPSDEISVGRWRGRIKQTLRRVTP